MSKMLNLVRPLPWITKALMWNVVSLQPGDFIEITIDRLY